ncbi:MAG: Mur ligase domain-containing protein, partial [Victivallaceae bacterium]|nr:Mur ligase domain-containing protein [Victivallaceae bacterium]
MLPGKIHFVGAGGAGMTPLAFIAMELGATASGSDEVTSANRDRLTERGMKTAVGHKAENLPDN